MAKTLAKSGGITFIFTQGTGVVSDAKRIYTGFNHRSLYYLNTSDVIRSCGEGSTGQLGLGSTSDQNTFGSISSTHFSTLLPLQFFHGVDTTMALTRDGKLWGWGRNDFLQVAQTSGNKTSPTERTDQVISGTIRQIAVGDDHSGFVTSDGTIYTTGRNNQGQLGIGNNTDQTTYVSPTLSLGTVPSGLEYELSTDDTAVRHRIMSSFSVRWRSYELDPFNFDQL